MSGLLVVEVGNTRTGIGMADGDQWRWHDRVPTHPFLSSDEVATLIRGHGTPLEDLSAVAVSSVVPAATESFLVFARQHLQVEPLVVTGETPAPLVNRYANPGQLGSDRWVGAIAAFERYGAPLIVVSLGTATTVDVVSAQGEFLGGAIAPGVVTCAEALSERAAQLFRVPLAAPATALATDTGGCLGAGLWHGSLGQVEGILAAVREELRSPVEAVVTGGLGEVLGPHLTGVRAIEPLLAMEGVRIAWEFQHDPRGNA
jgi:type III pantothenate kinase